MHVDDLHFQHEPNPGAPPLVILHGLFGSSSNWRSLARRFSVRHDVYCLDLRNHGQSPWDDEMDYLSLALDVEHFMKTRNLYHPSVIGHSMGGKTAMMIAQDLRIPLHRLVVADIAPVPYSHSHEAFVTAMQQADLAGAKNRQDVDRMLAGAVPEPGTRQFLLQNLRRQDDRFSWRLNLDAIADNMDRLLDYQNEHVATMPALFIRGENSEYILPVHEAAIQQRFPDSHIETLPGTGHWLHAEDPDGFFAVCNAFLSDPPTH